MVEATPMPTVAEEWGARFMRHIISVLTTPGSEWTQNEATDAALNEWAAVKEQNEWSVEDDPAAYADECLSYWDDDGDDI